MSLPRSMWFHSTSFACLVSAMVSNYLNVYFSPHVTLSDLLRLCILSSMYIVIHVESTADTMFG